ncbi:IS66 family transposase [Paraliomyxa miuraensis]|uniref:IS66 family transposase n=1 Tax=Paraliomyxa miuraensis TaxID=376150 RepID=UPI003899FBCB
MKRVSGVGAAPPRPAIRGSPGRTHFIERAGGKRPGCWAHGRRRLVEAASAGDLVAHAALHIIARLFALERAATFAGDTAEQRRARRLES